MRCDCGRTPEEQRAFKAACQRKYMKKQLAKMTPAQVRRWKNKRSQHAREWFAKFTERTKQLKRQQWYQSWKKKNPEKYAQSVEHSREYRRSPAGQTTYQRRLKKKQYQRQLRNLIKYCEIRLALPIAV